MFVTSILVLLAVMTGAHGACSADINNPVKLDLTSGQTYIITSPNYPSNYSANTTCYWTVNAPTGQVLGYDLVVSMESSAQCAKDYLKLIDNNMTTTLCGSSIRFTGMTTVSNQLIIQFKSDGDIQYPGFSLSAYLFTQNDYTFTQTTTTRVYFFLPLGAIIGIVVGGIALIVLLGVAIKFLCCKKATAVTSVPPQPHNHFMDVNGVIVDSNKSGNQMEYAAPYPPL